MNSICCLCKASFQCGAVDLLPTCWCKKKPAIPLEPHLTTCLCEACFDDRLAQKTLTVFRLFMAYRGGNFAGFQEQGNLRTVAGELKKAVKAIIQQDVTINAAGRTDSGVHARGQVVSIEVNTRLLPKQLMLALAAHLPPDMAVWRIDKMPIGFDARRQSIGKQYIYRIYQGLVADPFYIENSLHIKRKLNIEMMVKAAKVFVGEHDFSSFRSSLCASDHAKRYIWYASVNQTGALIKIDIRGNAFCMNMVRIMVGTLIEVGTGKRTIESVQNALIQKDRKMAGITAKAQGLTLERVYYPDDDLTQAQIPEGAVFPRYPVTEHNWTFSSKDIDYGPI